MMIIQLPEYLHCKYNHNYIMKQNQGFSIKTQQATSWNIQFIF